MNKSVICVHDNDSKAHFAKIDNELLKESGK